MGKNTILSFQFLVVLFVSFAVAENVINVNFAGLLSGWNSPVGVLPTSTPTSAPTTAPSGYVYGRTNEPSGNDNVVAYKRDKTGYLWEIGRYSTNGFGVSGAIDPLGSQNSLIFSPDKNWILSVNGGSNTIAVFKRNWDGSLTFSSLTSSYPGANSSTPTSLAAWGNWVYVLNSGATLTSISGFSADWTTGVLTFLPASQTSFSGKYGQISFSPDGSHLIISGKGGDLFRIFPLDGALPTNPAGIISTVTPGLTPFSFVYDRTGNYLLAALAFGGVGSFQITAGGPLTTVQVINTTDAATCWIARNPNSDNFYAVNAGKPSISAFTSFPNGTITQINGKTQISATATDPDVVLFPAASVPLDLAITSDNQFLYVLLGGRGTIAGYWIKPDGTLLSRGEAELQLPGYNGLNGILAD